MIADFWDAVEEVERVRSLGVWGFHELRQALEREEQRLGVTTDDPNLSPEDARSLQAAWERAQLADAELSQEYPHLNSQALVSLTSALDAMVEDFVAANRSFMIQLLIRRLNEARPYVGVEYEDLSSEQIDERVRKRIEAALPKIRRLRGPGLKRYERHLAHVGFDAPRDRPVPTDLGVALSELTTIRNLLVHRAGRIDKRSLNACPTLADRFAEGQLLRMSRADYRVYSAAIRCYAGEIQFRTIRNWPNVSDDTDGPQLENWRDYYRLGA